MNLHHSHTAHSALPPAGQIHQVDTLDEPRGVEEEVLSIKHQLSSADRDKTRRLLEQLKSLNSRLPRTGRKSRRSAGVIIAAIAQAEHQLEAQQDETYRHNFDSLEARRAFVVAVYDTMSRMDRQFFHTIDNGATYTIAPVSDTGVVHTAAKQEVTGEELQHKFSILKYHSLSEGEKRDVLHRTFGTNGGDDLPADAEGLRRQRKEVAVLHSALRDMEAYRAYLHFTQSTGFLMGAMGKIGRDHEVFAKAHGQVEDVLAAYDRLIANPGDEAAKAELKRLRTLMRQTLKDEVIGRVLESASSAGNGLQPKILDTVETPRTPMFIPDVRGRETATA